MKPTGVWVAIGVAFGVLVSVVNNTGFDVPTNTAIAPLEVLSYLIGVGWPWATFAVVAGWHARRHGASRPVAVLAATAGLAAAVVGYYAADDAFGAYDFWNESHYDLRFWLIGAAVTGPPLGLVGTFVGPTLLGRAAALVVPAMAIVDTRMRLSPFDKPIRSATSTAVLVVAAIVALVIIARPRALARVAAEPAQRHTSGG